MFRLNKYVFLIFLLLNVQCEKKSNPVSTETKNSISSQPVSYTYTTDPNSYVYETYPKFRVSRDRLNATGIFVLNINRILYPESRGLIKYDILREFVISPEDSFEVEIQNCKQGKPFVSKIDGKNLVLSKEDTVFSNDSLYTVRFLFRSLGNDKGYVGFAECTDSSSNSVSSDSPGFIIGYNLGLQNNLWVNLEKIIWEYDTEGFSTLSLSLEGRTNAYRMKIETYGDGIISSYDIPIDTDGCFEHRTWISFSHVSGIYLKANTRIALYGTIGLPKVITLENPLSKY